jgi:hypothetical protein
VLGFIIDAIEATRLLINWMSFVIQ